MMALEKCHQMIKDVFGDLDIDGLKITIENKKAFTWNSDKKEFTIIDIESEERL